MAESQTETEIETEAAPNKVTIEDAGPAKKKITIEVPAETIADKLEESMNTLGNEAAVPGFRPGRVPRKLIERRFGSTIREDVQAQIISEAYSKAIEDNSIEVLGEPDLQDADDLKLPEEGAFTFTIEIEVVPDVDLPDFSKIKVTSVEQEVTDEDITKEIDQLRDRLGEVAAVGDSAIEEKDYVQAEVTLLDGKDAKDEAEEIAKHTGVYILVNGESAEYKGHVVGIVVDDLGKQLAGKKVGDELRISTTGPAQHEDENIRDKEITIVIKIENIERIKPADVSVVVERMGHETEEQLKDFMKQQLEERNTRQAQAEQFDQIREQLDEAIELDLPERMTGRQTARMLRQRAMELAYRGTPEDQIEQQIAEARGSTEEEAKKGLKLFFILDKAARELEVDVQEGELNGRIAMMAMQQGRRPEKVRQEMQRSGEIESLAFQIREQRTLEKILEQANVEGAPAKKDDSKDEKAEEKSEKKKSTKKKTSKKDDEKK